MVFSAIAFFLTADERINLASFFKAYKIAMIASLTFYNFQNGRVLQNWKLFEYL
jgi:hypothetical protein